MDILSNKILPCAVHLGEATHARGFGFIRSYAIQDSESRRERDLAIRWRDAMETDRLERKPESGSIEIRV